MVNYKIRWTNWIDLIRITIESFHRISHCSKIYYYRYPSKVLIQYSTVMIIHLFYAIKIYHIYRFI